MKQFRVVLIGLFLLGHLQTAGLSLLCAVKQQTQQEKTMSCQKNCCPERCSSRNSQSSRSSSAKITSAFSCPLKGVRVQSTLESSIKQTVDRFYVLSVVIMPAVPDECPSVTADISPPESPPQDLTILQQNFRI